MRLRAVCLVGLGVLLAGCTSGITRSTAPKAATTAYTFVHLTRTISVFGCNVIVSPGRTAGSSVDASIAWRSAPEIARIAGVPGIAVQLGQHVHPIVEYVALTDNYYGRDVHGIFHPFYNHTPVWVVEYPHVATEGSPSIRTETSRVHETSKVSETFVYVLRPGTYQLLEIDLC